MKLELAVSELMEKKRFFYTLQVKHGINVMHLLESLMRKKKIKIVGEVLVITTNIDNYNNCRELGIEVEYLCNFLDSDLRDAMGIEEYKLVILDRSELSTTGTSEAFYLMRELYKVSEISVLALVNLDTIGIETYPLLKHYTEVISVTDSVVLPTTGWSKNLLHYYDKLRAFQPLTCKVTKNIVTDNPAKINLKDIQDSDVIVVPHNTLLYHNNKIREALGYTEGIMAKERLVLYSDAYCYSRSEYIFTIIPKGSFVKFKEYNPEMDTADTVGAIVEYEDVEYYIGMDKHFLLTLNCEVNEYAKVYYSMAVSPNIMDLVSFDNVLFLTYDSLIRNDVLKTLRGTRNSIDIRYNRLYDMI